MIEVKIDGKEDLKIETPEVRSFYEGAAVLKGSVEALSDDCYDVSSLYDSLWECIKNNDGDAINRYCNYITDKLYFVIADAYEAINVIEKIKNLED